MESSRIQQIKNEIYIPKQPLIPIPSITSHHPTLIMQDKLTDTTHHSSCGCCGPDCITKKAWFYGPNGEVKSSSSYTYSLNR
ncbi:uncharacterized protein ASCRUDRAFT_78122 [Ascoidea rubescens DSM 1968]|uniref:Uncharacterized protein n=1 Tax=Ascoidea rubescens DSM 1968 TaxID=1344418 RepID=A0A1D2V9R9_9ASCO|nr:hypothetical protein ASCRUDRAFT_78122 [Ascoidea rubescens DSM 1968]ODV58213.1 hypothetical protein ASCRUDRAFT_78122 [Ascoidea rubescens DSM 1968]